MKPTHTQHHPWHELCNLHAGKPAIVVGKGPSLQAWIQGGRPRPADAVIIAVNEAAHAVHASGQVPDYAVSNHRCTWFAEVPTQWVVSLPGPPKNFQIGSNSWAKPAWAAHWFLHVHGSPILLHPREETMDNRILYNQSSSAQPAVHFAAYLGCSSLTLVGIDGAGGYAPEAAAHCPHVASGDDHYTHTRTHTDLAARTLFPDRWQHWQP